MIESVIFIMHNIPELLNGAFVAIAVTLLSILVGLVVGIIIAFFGLYGSKMVKNFIYIFEWVLRGTPILVILFIIYFGFPTIGIKLGPFTSAVIGLGLRSAAYLSQVFKGAIQSIATDQMEAGLSIGLPKYKALFYIIIPQTVRLAFPGFINEFTIVLKDSPLVYAVGIGEILSHGRSIIVMQGKPFEIYFACSIIYFALFYAFYYVFNFIAKQFEVPGFAIKAG